MKNLIYLLVALAVGVGLAWFLRDTNLENIHPGYVIIGYGRWSVETSLIFAVLTLTVAFLLIYVALSLCFGVIRLPFFLVRAGARYREKRSNQVIATAYQDSAEHRRAKAEKALIRHASQSTSPLMNFLTAARSAQARGDTESRDEYLEMARENDPKAELAIGLTEAELCMANGEYERARDVLLKLRQLVPNHKGVLDFLQQTYRKLEDWETLLEFSPVIYKAHVLSDAEFREMEVEVYTGLMHGLLADRDLEGVKDLWQSAPPRVQSADEMRLVYYRCMIALGGSDDVEEPIRLALKAKWDEKLLQQYGSLVVSEPKKPLETAESWLDKHPHDAYLLRALGRLSIQCQDFAKAERYLTSSVTIYPCADTYVLLGDLNAGKGDYEKANECYRRAVTVASEEVAKELDNFPVDVVKSVRQASAAA